MPTLLAKAFVLQYQIPQRQQKLWSRYGVVNCYIFRGKDRDFLSWQVDNKMMLEVSTSIN